jgi:hypothetical protein
MPDLPDVARTPRVPQWQYDPRGRQRLNGRWNKERIAEWLAGKSYWQSCDDIARVVYGSTSETRRVNVRRHIPAQRRYMLFELQQPIITRYGPRGTIMAVKIYNPTSEDDKIILRTELDRARDREELSHQHHQRLLNVFLLTST